MTAAVQGWEQGWDRFKARNVKEGEFVRNVGGVGSGVRLGKSGRKVRKRVGTRCLWVEEGGGVRKSPETGGKEVVGREGKKRVRVWEEEEG